MHLGKVVFIQWNLLLCFFLPACECDAELSTGTRCNADDGQCSCDPIIDGRLMDPEYYDHRTCTLSKQII